MIERLPYPKILSYPPAPDMGVKERASIECGCHVWVGMRFDNQEVATMAVPCSREHRALMEHFNVLMAESLAEPRDDDLVVVCEELLLAAAREIA